MDSGIVEPGRSRFMGTVACWFCNGTEAQSLQCSEAGMLEQCCMRGNGNYVWK